MIDAAKKYLENGISVLPVDNLKRPLIPWQKYQNELMPIQDAENYFSNAYGIGTIGGKISGGREHIDIDTKYDLTGNLYQYYVDNIPEEIFKKLVVVQTPSGGYHLIYNVEQPLQSQKLANRYTTDEERAINPNEKVKVLIETKGEGGYCLAPPTLGYECISDNKRVSLISVEERDILFDIAKSINEVIAEVSHPTKVESVDNNTFLESPFEDYNSKNDVNELLISKGWSFVRENGVRVYYRRPGDTKAITSGDWHKEKRLFKVWSTSTELEPNKGYSPVSLLCKLHFDNNWKECFKWLIKNKYGMLKQPIRHELNKKIHAAFTDGMTNDEVRAKLLKTNLPITEIDDAIRKYNANKGDTIKSFWQIVPQKDLNAIPKIVFNLDLFVKFLSTNLNVKRFYINSVEDGIYKLIELNNNVIKEVSINYVIDKVKQYVQSLPYSFDGITRDSLMNAIINQAEKIYSNSTIKHIDVADLQMLRDDENNCYFYFENCVVKITSESITMHTYNEFKDYNIWQSSIIKKHFKFEEFDKFDFNVFINKINADEPYRIERCRQIIGYLLHTYKDPIEPIAPIFGEETADSAKGGGTGKGILISAIGKMRNIVIMDGKNFKSDKNFLWQRVKLDTNIVCIQDTRKGFNFESLFSTITDGMVIERKNKDEFILDYANAPKFTITTNFTVNNDSEASDRRQALLEFSDFFGTKNKPINYFNRPLLYNWNNDEWNCFYCTMFNCVKEYLSKKIQPAIQTESNKWKQIQTKYGDDFVAWWKWYVRSDVSGQFNKVSNLYERFLKDSGIDKHKFQQNYFSRAITFACNIFSLKKESSRDGSDNCITIRINDMPF